MKKGEFLRELRYNLMGKVSDDELENIIMDYDEIFESGKAEGKTEEEIADMLGSPALVAKAILDESPNTSAMSEKSGYTPASLGKRIMAFIIDYVLSLVPLILLCAMEATRTAILLVSSLMIFNPVLPAFLIFSLSPQERYFLSYSGSGVQGVFAYSPHVIYIRILLILLGFIFFWLYGTLAMTLMKGRTVGMRLMGIRVVKKDRSALKPIDIIVRQFVGKVLLAGITSNISYIVSLFWAIFSKANNTIHDKLAGTMVIEER